MIRWFALLLTVLTGFTGLVYEIAWHKYVVTLLGSHSEATAAVLSLFLGGLALGYALFGRVTRKLTRDAGARGRPPRLLLVYGIVEAGIGVHALLFPWIFHVARALSLARPDMERGLGFLLDVGITGLLILPPTILMGGTIPLLTQALARSLADATRFHALVYAFNTTGAFLGAVAAGFFMIPWLGLERVVLSMGCVNITAGAVFVAIGLQRARATALPSESEGSGPPIGSYASVALLAGFAAMTLQTVLIRMGGLSLGSSQFTFSTVVAVFVLCIAIGSFGVSALPRVPKGLVVGVQWLLLVLLGALYLKLDEAPFWAYRIRSAFGSLDADFYPYHLTVFGAVLAFLALPVALSGATLPLLFHRLGRDVGDLGRAAGRLYAWNTVGSLLGALLGGYLLLFFVNLDDVYRIALAAIALTASLLTRRVYAVSRPITAVLLAATGVGIALLPNWDQERLSVGAFRFHGRAMPEERAPKAFFAAIAREQSQVFYRDDPNSSVAVLRTPLPGFGMDTAIKTNGKPDGSIIGDYPTMALASLFPVMFAEEARSAFVIGYGTGVSVGELAALESMDRVVVAEISPAVMEAARFFEKDNQAALASPKTEVVLGDAYRALLRTPERFDVIVSEPSNPWVTGVEMLFSQEFLMAARARLTPGGVYAQWFHLYENDTEVVELVLRTYSSVFENVAVWWAKWPDVILLGFNDATHALDLERVLATAARPDVAAGLERSGVSSVPDLLIREMLPLGVIQAAGSRGEVHTLFHPVLSHRAARAFFAGTRATFPPMLGERELEIGEENSLLRRWLAARGHGLLDGEYADISEEICGRQIELCVTVLAHWLREHPESEALARQIESLRGTPVYQAQLGREALALVSGLVGHAGAARSVTAPVAERMTDLFVRHYYFGLPLSREALAAVWDGCREDTAGATACSVGRARAEVLVGSLGNGSGAPPRGSTSRTQR